MGYVKGTELVGIHEVMDFLVNRSMIAHINVDGLKELLKVTHVNILLEGINRWQSTLLCELKDSYVQQSQRYVALKGEYYSPTGLELALSVDNRLKTMMNKAYDLYERMSELTEEGLAKTGRKTAEDYKYGIPIEDARYVFPLATKTNMSITMSGDKLFDFFYLLQTSPAFDLAFIMEICNQFPEALINIIAPNLFTAPRMLNLYKLGVKEFYSQYFNKLNIGNNLFLVNRFENPDKNCTVAGRISQTQIIPEVDGTDTTYCQEFIKRLNGYGHTGINEHARTTYAFTMSLSAYHQQIRHRLPVYHREELIDIANDTFREPYIPTTIANSIFMQEYIDFITEWKNLRIALTDECLVTCPELLLLNAEMIKLTMNVNARADTQILKERTCFTAQEEIRNLAVKRLKDERTHSGVLYEDALPSCVKRICKEGKMTCGRSAEAKELFGVMTE